MRKYNVSFFVVVATLLVGLAAWSGASKSQTKPAAPAAPAAHLFDPIGQVLMHPRCMNCHTNTEFPRQWDAGVRHSQMVMRGKDNKGAPTLQCSTCHQNQNSADGRVPGAEGWHLPPLSMGWEKLSAAEICQSIQDPARNGHRVTGAEVIAHMDTDPLVLWAWAPGKDRSSPPISHAQLMQALNTWADAGMPCPKK